MTTKDHKGFLLLHLSVFIAPLLYALVIYLAFIASRKRTLRPIQLYYFSAEKP